MNGNGTKRIVAIDDDTLMLDVIRIILEEYDYKVHTHISADEALDGIKKRPPDMILLDLAMPNKSGVDVLNELKQTDLLDKIPVILISASENIKEVASKFNVASYIQKPFGVNELYKTVKREINSN